MAATAPPGRSLSSHFPRAWHPLLAANLFSSPDRRGRPATCSLVLRRCRPPRLRRRIWCRAFVPSPQLREHPDSRTHEFALKIGGGAARLFHHRRIQQDCAAIRKRTLPRPQSGRALARRRSQTLAPPPIHLEIPCECAFLAGGVGRRPIERSSHGSYKLPEECFRERALLGSRRGASRAKRARYQAPYLHGDGQQGFAPYRRLELAKPHWIARQLPPVVPLGIRLHESRDHPRRRERTHQPVRQFVRVRDKKFSRPGHAHQTAATCGDSASGI